MQNCNHRAFHQPYMHVVIALFCSLLFMCYIASIFHVLISFRASTFMLQTFQTTSKVLLGRGSILSDAIGVDGLTYLPSLQVLSFLDGLKPYLFVLSSLELFNVISV